MKCIRHIITGEVRRVSDEEARSKVVEVPKGAKSAWVYVPKQAWKAKSRNKQA